MLNLLSYLDTFSCLIIYFISPYSDWYLGEAVPVDKLELSHQEQQVKEVGDLGADDSWSGGGELSSFKHVWEELGLGSPTRGGRWGCWTRSTTGSLRMCTTMSGASPFSRRWVGGGRKWEIGWVEGGRPGQRWKEDCKRKLSEEGNLGETRRVWRKEAAQNHLCSEGRRGACHQ